MTTDTRIMRGRRRVPVVAFLGTKGGVGTTTIARRFGELITLAESAPNVLLVDVDVHRRGMTVEIEAQNRVTCNTVHDYVASRHTNHVEAADLTGTVEGSSVDSGRQYFVPASSPDSDRVFAESASVDPAKVLETLSQVMAKAVQTYDCECVVIDCGSVIDPYTGAAAMLADRAFIIGQNEPISFSSLKTYPSRVRDFYPDFRTDKMKVIINKVRGWEQLEQRKLQGQEEIFAAIPFTMDIVDVSEGLSETNAMQRMLFEDHIAQIIEKVFKSDYPELVPLRQTLLPPEWGSLVENPERLEQAPKIKRLGLARYLLPLGLLVAILGAVLFYGAVTKRHPPVTEVEPVKPNTARENLGIGLVLAGVALSGVGFLCSRSRKNYLYWIEALSEGGPKWLISEMKASKSARRTFGKLLEMVEPETVSLNLAREVVVTYLGEGGRRRRMLKSARLARGPDVTVVPRTSIEDDFAREIRTRIKQAQGWSSSLTEDLLRFADIVGLSDRQARKILDRTLLRLGFDNANNFDDGKNVARFRELVGYFLESGGISPERRTILKNRAREWGVSPGVAKAVEFSERGPDLSGVQASRLEEVNWKSPSSIQYAVEENQQPLRSPASTESSPAPLELREGINKERHKESTERATEKSVEGEDKSRLELDPVDCTVFAPPSVGQNQNLLVQVFVHLHEQAEEARDLAVEFDPDSQRRVVKNLETKIARGTKLTFDLVMRGLEIDDPVQSLIWNGRPEGVQFGVTVPSGHPIGTVIGTVTVSQDSVPIGHIKFKLAITAASMTQSTQEAEPVGDAARRYTKAFVSYASKDLDKVRPRLQMLSLQGIDYFQDKFGLEPGDRWEKKLYVNIDQCDLFLLFWSSAAKESEWVRREVNYALDRKAGDDFAPPEIHPVVIEGPPVPDPWEEVAHIQFDDWRIHYHA